MATRNELEAAKEEIKANWRLLAADFLEPAKVKGQFICPFCGHGAHGDGLKHDPTSKGAHGLKCFGCNWHGDIIALYQKAKGASFLEAVRDLAAKLGRTLDIDEPRASERPPRATPPRGQGSPTPHQAAGPAKTEPAKDVTEYCARAAANLTEGSEGAAYLESRGIPLAQAKAFGLGFDPKWQNPAASPGRGLGTGTPRLIIPTSPTHYVARDIRPREAMTAEEWNNKALNGGRPTPFNGAALYQEAGAVFIVEGWADALAVMAAGGVAIALNSTANVRRFLEGNAQEGKQETWPKIDPRKVKVAIIAALDNDQQGRAAQEDLISGLKKLGLSVMAANVAGGYKDAAEALQKDAEAFKKAVGNAIILAAAPDDIDYYIENQMADEIGAFASEHETGFPNLDASDKAGGLYSGLYVVAAVPSLGKTTFCLQMADNITRNGGDVIFFSLEMSKLEMATKSISRTMAQLTEEGDNRRATSLYIRKGKTLFNNVFKEAIEKLKAERGGRLSIVETRIDDNIETIEAYISQYIARTGRRPVVFIDYLQIIPPAAPSESGHQKALREAIDDTSRRLKAISNNYNTPVIVISSMNRANYMKVADFEAVKESGGIEYCCDVLWGLQFSIVESSAFDNDVGGTKEKRRLINEAKYDTWRKITLVCLKNRYGRTGWKAYFKYCSAYDLFEPWDEDEAEGEIRAWQASTKGGRK